MDANLDRIARALATRRATLGAIVAGAALALPAARADAKKKKCNACCPKKKLTFAQLQFLHASPNAPAVDVYADGVLVATALAYGETTDLGNYDSGQLRITVVPAGGDPASPVLDLTETLEPCRSYLFAIAGLVPAMTDRALAGLIGMPFEQDRSKIKDETVARASALHLSPDGPVVGVRLEEAAAAGRGFGAGGTVIATNIQFGDQSAAVEIPAGTYDVVVFDAATDAEALRVPGVRFDGRTLTQVAVIGLVGGAPALSSALVVNASCCGRYVIS